MSDSASGVHLADIIASLSTDFSELKHVIRTLGSPSKGVVPGVSIRIHYLPFSEGKARIGELLDTVRAYICNFALSRAEIHEVHRSVASASQQERLVAYTRLSTLASDLFIKAQKSTGRNGECGELLLYLLTEWVLGAPQLLAKMSLKTSGQMPVHGSDGIHVKYDSDKDRLIFYWGEAKVHKSVNSAIKAAVDSIATTLKFAKLKEDIRLVRRFVHLTGLSAAAQTELVEYLDPLNSKYDKKVNASVCLIGFDFDGFKRIKGLSQDVIEAEFCKLLDVSVSKASVKLCDELVDAGIHQHEMEVFFLPFESVNRLREEFQNSIGWKS
jgi:hypothetical protein